MDCSACKQKLAQNSEILKCITCPMKFHYACLNITSTFYLKNKVELNKSWRCPSCENVTRRIRNDHTPVRKQPQDTLNESIISPDDLAHDLQYTSKCEELSSHIDKERVSKSLIVPKENSTILEQIGFMLDKKLEENKKSILDEIKKSIQYEIQQSSEKYIKDMNAKTDFLMNEQTNIQKQVNSLNMTIQKLEKENKCLEEEIKIIQKTLQNSHLSNNSLDNSRKLVLYGLAEHNHEMEDHLQYRIINIFQEILNIDLTGYIEELTRIGRKGFRRPIVIELLSKKTTKYILQNNRFFKNTGLFISEYLDKNAYQDRKSLQNNLQAARQNGHRAFIRNNKLYIDGKISHTYQKQKTSMSAQSLQRDPSLPRSSASVIETSTDSTYNNNAQIRSPTSNFRC